jgi:hypothetical protein
VAGQEIVDVGHLLHLQAIGRKVSAGDRYRGTVAARLRQFVMLDTRGSAGIERMRLGSPPGLRRRFVARRTEAQPFAQALAERDRARVLLRNIVPGSNVTGQPTGPPLSWPTRPCGL